MTKEEIRKKFLVSLELKRQMQEESKSILQSLQQEL